VIKNWKKNMKIEIKFFYINLRRKDGIGMAS